MKQHHFLITCFPVQGHINPTLQLAKNLSRLGAAVTFATTARGLKRLDDRLSLLPNFSFTSFSDGSNDGDDNKSPTGDATAYWENLRRSGSENLTKILRNSFHTDRPVTCVVYTLLMPWAATVARDMHVPSAFLAIQCAAAFAVYRRFYSRHDGIHEGGIDSSVSLRIQDLPTFSCSELPTFVLPENPMNAFMGPMMIDHIQELETSPNSIVLLNTFEELEAEAIRDFEDKLNVVAVGPLIPSAFAGGTDSADTSFGGDLFGKKDDDDELFKWLGSKEEKSVVYVAFGSLVVMKKEQKVEILHALVESKRPYLWVLRSSDSEEEEEVKEMIESEKRNGDGKIVTWCSQAAVLSHKSIGCFVTHCGWNSTLESLACGVPLVGCPHFSDQTTNAKLVEEVWGNGVRAGVNGEVVVGSEELKKCLDVVMGEGEIGVEIRGNAWKWRRLAIEAVKGGGSTYNNLRKVIDSF